MRGQDLTILWEDTRRPIAIKDLQKMGAVKLTCIAAQEDYNFKYGHPYPIHYGDEENGPYIFGTTGFFGSSDKTSLGDLTQDILNKFLIKQAHVDE